ncbi:MAG TPA: alpha/beta hydrolase [Planctomycetaceae bacterium]|nr:alpha/beta hydrolase [Planctomycetaceae bacterium]
MPLKTLAIAILLGIYPLAHARAEVNITADVVYGHKFGLANTFDVFTPSENANGAAVLFMVSGGWYSNWSPPQKLLPMMTPLTDAGYTVFAVRHGSSPRFSIPEAVEDVRRSVRFIRMQSKQFGIDPERLGVFGMSAGGHLSLMLGTTGDDGSPNAQDPVEKTSDRVQAVVAWVAPTDLTIMTHASPEALPAYKNFPALDLAAEPAKKHSPLMYVTDDDAPTLLLAGAVDDLVPIDHSRRIHKKFEEIGVANRLVEFPNAGHGLAGEDMKRAVAEMVRWFDTHLAVKDAATEATTKQ